PDGRGLTPEPPWSESGHTAEQLHSPGPRGGAHYRDTVAGGCQLMAMGVRDRRAARVHPCNISLSNHSRAAPSASQRGRSGRAASPVGTGFPVTQHHPLDGGTAVWYELY